MTNVPFSSIDDFRDLDSVNAYHELVGQGVFTEEQMLKYLRRKSRDNARTPFQWNSGSQAGFTAGTPWIMVNPNYKEINAEEQMNRPDSVFHYYQKLIRLRKEREIVVYGSYDLLLPESEEIYAYTRTLGDEKLLTVCNFTDHEVRYEVPEEFRGGDCLISNYDAPELNESVTLRPYEAFAAEKKE